MVLLALALAGATPALAAPMVVVEKPANNSRTNSTSPTIAGTTNYTPETPAPVTVKIYTGAAPASGLPAQTLVATPDAGGKWSTSPSPALSQGTYTVIAEQTALTEVGTSNEVTFTVDTTKPAVTLDPVPSPTGDATPTLSGELGTEEGDLPEVTVTIYKGNSVGGAVASSGAAKVSGKSWTYKVSEPLPDGPYTALATQWDTAKNKGESSPQSFSVKAKQPAVTLDEVPTPSKDATPTLGGKMGVAEGDLPAVEVRIYKGGSVGEAALQSGAATVNEAAGTWTYAAGHLEDDTYTAQAIQKDKAGNTGKSPPRTFVIDTVPPAVTLNPISSPLANSKPTLRGGLGTQEDDLREVVVTISKAGTEVSKGAASVSEGSWSYTPKEELADGQYTVFATQRDTAGNIGTSSTEKFTVKASKPIVTIEPPPPMSRKSTLSFSGTADTAAGNLPSITVRVYRGSEKVREVSATAGGGKWETSPVELADGTYTAQAEQKDEAGNIGVSNIPTFTIRTKPPIVSISPYPARTKDSTPTLQGARGNAPGDKEAVTVTVYEETSGGKQKVASSTLAVTGGVQWSYTAPHLADATYTAIATQEDEAGNVGESAPVTFTVDTVAPEVTLDPVPTPSNNATPTLTGGAENDASDGSSVKVTILDSEGHVAASGSTERNGARWSIKSSHLADGTYTAHATQTDEVGNTGTSSTQSFTVNTASPKVTLNSPAPLSNNATPSFNGTASDTTPVTVEVFSGAPAKGPAVWKTSASVAGGNWSSASVSPPLADGQYTAIAIESSSLGNPDGKSAAVTFKVNTAAPTVTLNQPTSPSSNTNPTFTGTATDGTQVTIKVYEGEHPNPPVVSEATATPSGETWTSGPLTHALQTAKHTYTAVAYQQSSIKGNPEGTSVPMIFTVDTNAPTVTLTQLKTPYNNASPSFSGTGTDTSTVTVNIYKGKTIKNPPFTTATATPAAGAWTSGTTGLPLPDGEYVAQATQPSSIGNPPGASESIKFVIDTKAPAVTVNPLRAGCGLVAQPPCATNIPTPELTGKVGTEPGDIAKVLVKVYKGSGPEVAAEGEATISGAGKGATWSFKSSANLENGATYTVQATQLDEAGNTGTSPALTITIDTVPPTLTLNPPALRSNNRKPVFSGVASDTTPVTVTIYSCETCATKVSEATAKGTGTAWTSGPATPELPNVKGKIPYWVSATQTDEATNTTTTPRVKFVIDTEAPTVTLNQPSRRTNNRTPSFSGTAADKTPLNVYIYSPGQQPPGGACEKPGAFLASATASGTGGGWTSSAINHALPDGNYVLIAVQKSEFENHCGETAATLFTVDTVPPRVTTDSPANGSSGTGDSVTIGGSAGTSEGDLPSVTVQLYAGETIGEGQAPIRNRSVNVERGRWSEKFAGLSPGVYTARAEQSDEAGNVAVSATSTFALAAASAAAGRPSASFSWYPAAPHAGEVVSLVSSSTDPTSPLTAFGWDLAGNGPFQPGAHVLNTSFATPGNHVVRLQVTDAGGATSVATETIPVGSAQAPLMQPFPLVRIITTHTASGIRLRLLSILTSPGTRIIVTCKGHGCPIRKQSKIAAAGKVGLASVSFSRFERVLPNGTTLEIRVYKAGDIGKYTRLSIRRGALRRADACLASDGRTPIVCPSS